LGKGNQAESGLEAGWNWHDFVCKPKDGFLRAQLTDKRVARDKINSVATQANGNGRKPLEEGVSGAQQMLALAAAFKGRGYVFKHMPQAKCAEIRWQAGRDVLDPITMPSGDCLLLERFELLAWGANANELIERLAAHE
jgi:hypothetical protein